MTIDQLLKFSVDQQASDLHLQTGSPPRLRITGQVREIESPPLGDDQLRQFIRAIAPRAVGDDINVAMVRGHDFAYAMPGVARFRCNLYSHLGSPGLVVRLILPKIRTLEELHLPPLLAELAAARRGLVLMSGATGSGKSTTLAALVDLLNSTYHLKILTIEDPVEYEHAAKKSLVSHVEVGRDTPSFDHGLRQAMRQAPDVILVGELRDAETVQMALRAADTGHQVLATVHASNAPQTIERLLAMVPPAVLAIARQQLAAALVGIVSQRLTVGKDAMHWPVVELLRGDSVTAKYIMEDRIGDLADYIATRERGMQTFDQHLLERYQSGVVSGVQALAVATNPEALALEIRMPHAVVQERPRP
ncbi:MAG: twitching motility protein PilT [Planctomycetia bacterium 21-64-5]|nr:MAG: twitching motility protein PilT [Planctomycetia bacterium 21-64-5]HQU44727.1 PilT/PilU family type 4a pilus ATPase [Pirellulales bacterium]